MKIFSTLTFLALSLAVHAALINPSFETPVVYNDVANPTNAGWVFSGDAGLSCNNNGYTSLNPENAPDGTQVAYLGTLGSISQTFTNSKPGIYEFRLQAAQRYFPFSDLQQSFTVSFDGVILATYQPDADAFYYTFTTNIFLLQGSHTLAFQGQNPGMFEMVFIDVVQLQLVPTLQLTKSSGSVNLTVQQGLTNRVYTISRQVVVGGVSTVITNTINAQTVTLTNQPANQAFYYISALNDL